MFIVYQNNARIEYATLATSMRDEKCIRKKAREFRKGAGQGLGDLPEPQAWRIHIRRRDRAMRATPRGQKAAFPSCIEIQGRFLLRQLLYSTKEDELKRMGCG